MSAEKQPKRPKVEISTDLLRRMIIKGQLSPGSRLMEPELARLTGTSRTPVREALHLLEKENLVVRRKSGGYEVRPLNAREIQEFIGVRAVLESYAMRLAMPRVSLVILEALEANLADFEQAVKVMDKKALVDLNQTFHDIIHQTADSKVLIQVISDLSQVLQRFRMAILTYPEGAAQALKDHHRIYGAMKAGDVARAARCGEEHFLEGGRLMIAFIENDLPLST